MLQNSNSRTEHELITIRAFKSAAYQMLKRENSLVRNTVQSEHQNIQERIFVGTSVQECAVTAGLLRTSTYTILHVGPE